MAHRSRRADTGRPPQGKVRRGRRVEAAGQQTEPVTAAEHEVVVRSLRACAQGTAQPPPYSSGSRRPEAVLSFRVPRT